MCSRSKIAHVTSNVCSPMLISGVIKTGPVRFQARCHKRRLNWGFSGFMFILARASFFRFRCTLFFFSVVSTSAMDFLERLVSRMTRYVSDGTLNPTDSTKCVRALCGKIQPIDLLLIHLLLIGLWQEPAPVTKRDYCINELVETEKNYIEALAMIINVSQSVSLLSLASCLIYARPLLPDRWLVGARFVDSWRPFRMLVWVRSFIEPDFLKMMYHSTIYHSNLSDQSAMEIGLGLGLD